MGDMTPKKRVDPAVRQRIARWVKRWIAQREELTGEKFQVQELERRLGVGSGTGTRILDGERIGIDVLMKIVLLTKVSADLILFEDPPPLRPTRGG